MSATALHTTEPVPSGFGRPQLIFFCELAGAELYDLIASEGVLTTLVAQGYGVAVALRSLEAATAEAIRLLNARQVPVVAWLLLPPGEGPWLNLQNYPQAIEHYRAVVAWARAAAVHFYAVGLDVEPPSAEHDLMQNWGARVLLRRLWLARENVLFAAARSAYTELIAEIHHDGYEVHTYQLPILADDRRAGTTLAQRALDIVYLPADLEVLMCYSSVGVEALGNDLGGALIGSYGPAADALAVGIQGGGAHAAGSVGPPPLPWDALERDLLLAGRHTDTIYVYSLEACMGQGLLSRVAALDWRAEGQPVGWKRMLVEAVRALILIWLLAARFSRVVFAWLGWALFVLLLFRRLRSAGRRRT